MGKKALIIGVICLLMLVSIPIVTAKEYPKEEGPYNIILQGKCFGNGGYGKSIHLGPFWYLDENSSIEFSGFVGTTCIISGDNIYAEFCELNLTTNICLVGFKGYAPGFALWFMKALTPLAKIRIIGTCSEISVYTIG
ncbi:MAG: hypothetical protein IMZ43_08840 [Thermoplasmata archaeon]|nr:hypothetical protein [Thermoplasmata archaeon]